MPSPDAPVAIVEVPRRLAVGRVDRIARALPHQPVGLLDPVERPVQFGPRLFVCGDHRDMGSLQGALRSGRRAARGVCAALGVSGPGATARER